MKKKKHKGGAPRLGLGKRFSIALFKDQDDALRARMKRNNEDQAEALRNFLRTHKIK